MFLQSSWRATTDQGYLSAYSVEIKSNAKAASTKRGTPSVPHTVEIDLQSLVKVLKTLNRSILPPHFPFSRIVNYVSLRTCHLLCSSYPRRWWRRGHRRQFSAVPRLVANAIRPRSSRPWSKPPMLRTSSQYGQRFSQRSERLRLVTMSMCAWWITRTDVGSDRHSRERTLKICFSTSALVEALQLRRRPEQEVLPQRHPRRRPRKKKRKKASDPWTPSEGFRGWPLSSYRKGGVGRGYGFGSLRLEEVVMRSCLNSAGGNIEALQTWNSIHDDVVAD